MEKTINRRIIDMDLRIMNLEAYACKHIANMDEMMEAIDQLENVSSSILSDHSEETINNAEIKLKGIIERYSLVG